MHVLTAELLANRLRRDLFPRLRHNYHVRWCDGWTPPPDPDERVIYLSRQFKDMPDHYPRSALVAAIIEQLAALHCRNSPRFGAAHRRVLEQCGVGPRGGGVIEYGRAYQWLATHR